MNTREYFKVARAIGPFKASDCIELARIAAELDEAAAIRKMCPPATVSCETMPDETAPVNLSFGIKVY
jgi:hypothetical protein